MHTFIPSTNVTPSSQIWEDAYRRFETQEAEIAKFRRRLLTLGAGAWQRSARIGELFCGRGNGLHALAGLAFTHIEGIDLSPTLAALYEGPGRVTVGDCRELPWPAGSKDVLIVQGGLHHLPSLDEDLPRVLKEVRRVLVSGGQFVAVEPWLTPFLQVVHAASFSPIRRLGSKVNAFATMVEHERETYERWLTCPNFVRWLLESSFDVQRLSFARGKMCFVGTNR